MRNGVISIALTTGAALPLFGGGAAALAHLVRQDPAGWEDEPLAAWLADVRELWHAMRAVDVERAERLGERSIRQPERVVEALELLARGALGPDDVTPLASLLALCCASYLSAPEATPEVSPAQRARVLDAALRAVFDLPPDEGAYLLTLFATLDGLEPRHADLLSSMCQVRPLLPSALAALCRLGPAAVPGTVLRQRVWPAWLAQREELDVAADAAAVRLFLAAGLSEAFDWARARLELELRADAQAGARPDVATIACLAWPDSRQLCDALAEAWSGAALPPDGFGIHAGVPDAWPHAAEAALRWQSGAGAPAVRRLWLELALVEPGFRAWLAREGEDLAARALALRTLTAASASSAAAREDALAAARAAWRDAQRIATRPGFARLASACTACLEALASDGRGGTTGDDLDALARMVQLDARARRDLMERIEVLRAHRTDRGSEDGR